MKKEHIAARLKLTKGESTRVGQIYEQYSAEMSKIDGTKTAILKEYSQQYEALTDEQAEELIRRWLETDVERAKLLQQFEGIFLKVLSEKKVAAFVRLERRASKMMDAQLTSGLPPALRELWTILVERGDVRRRETNGADGF